MEDKLRTIVLASTMRSTQSNCLLFAEKIRTSRSIVSLPPYCDWYDSAAMSGIVAPGGHPYIFVRQFFYITPLMSHISQGPRTPFRNARRDYRFKREVLSAIKLYRRVSVQWRMDERLLGQVGLL